MKIYLSLLVVENLPSNGMIIHFCFIEAVGNRNVIHNWCLYMVPDTINTVEFIQANIYAVGNCVLSLMIGRGLCVPLCVQNQLLVMIQRWFTQHYSYACVHRRKLVAPCLYSLNYSKRKAVNVNITILTH